MRLPRLQGASLLAALNAAPAPEATKRQASRFGGKFFQLVDAGSDGAPAEWPHAQTTVHKFVTDIRVLLNVLFPP